jgi:hypothetical protein
MDWYNMDWPPSPKDGLVRVTDATDRAQQLRPTAVLAVIKADLGAGLCVPDAYLLARAVAPAGSGALGTLYKLATENRLLCRHAARWLDRSLENRPTPSELLSHLARTEVTVPPAIIVLHGPNGVFAATRGAVALGVASANGLRIDRHAVGQTVARCREIADQRFAELTAHPDAAEMFVNGTKTVPDDKGFRPTRPDQMRDWLRDQLTTLTDRLLLPVRVLLTPDKKIDIQLQRWPTWALGTEPLAALADVQAAECLGLALGPACARLHPDYTQPLAPESSAPDLVSYAQFRATAGLPSCFVPAPSASFVRIDLRALPLAHFCKGSTIGASANALASQLSKAPPILVTREQACTLVRLASSGASDAAISTGLGRLAGLTVTRQQAGVLVRALVGLLPRLAEHLRDPSSARLAEYIQATEAELVAWTGHTPPAPGEEGSQLRAFLGSKLADEFEVIEWDHADRLARWRARWPPPPNDWASEVAGEELNRRRHSHRLRERETVVTPSGAVVGCGTWVEARAAASAAHQVVLGVAFALLAAGYRVVAVTPDEVLLEEPECEEATAGIAAVVMSAVEDFVGPCDLPAPEVLTRW